MTSQSYEAGLLTQLTDAAFDAERAHMAKLAAREDRLKATLAELNGAQKARALAIRDPDEPATRAAADLLWNRWVEQRRMALNIELAQIRALRAAQEEKLRLAFGRQLAMSKVAAHLKQKDLQVRVRRNNYMS